MKHQWLGSTIFASLIATVIATEGASAETASELRQALLDAFMAEQIAIDCPSLVPDRKQHRLLDKRVRAARKDQKLSEERLFSEYLQLSQRDIFTYGTAFEKTQNIDADNVASSCSAGERLIEEGNPVGTYLRKR